MEYNFYKLLNVRPDFIKEELDDAYERISRDGNPLLEKDFPDAVAFQACLDQAYATLSDPLGRQRYEKEHPDFLKKTSPQKKSPKSFFDESLRSERVGDEGQSKSRDRFALPASTSDVPSGYSDIQVYSEQNLPSTVDHRDGLGEAAEFAAGDEQGNADGLKNSDWINWKKQKRKQESGGADGVSDPRVSIGSSLVRQSAYTRVQNLPVVILKIHRLGHILKWFNLLLALIFFIFLKLSPVLPLPPYVIHEPLGLGNYVLPFLLFFTPSVLLFAPKLFSDEGEQDTLKFLSSIASWPLTGCLIYLIFQAILPKITS